MVSLEIVNRAAVLLGEPTLAAIDSATDSKFSKTLQNVYQNCIDAVLAITDWYCARVRQPLSQDVGVTPGFGYSYQFSLPSDMVRFMYLVDTNGDVIQNGYEVVGDKLITTYASVCLYYIKRISRDDTSALRPYVGNLIADYMAKHLCWQITGNATLGTQLSANYETALELAKTINTREGSFLTMSSSTYTDAHENVTR